MKRNGNGWVGMVAVRLDVEGKESEGLQVPPRLAQSHFQRLGTAEMRNNAAGHLDKHL